MTNQRDRAVGSLFGLAVGDAIGTTVEFLPRDNYPVLKDMIGGGAFKLDPGQWTDDTSMAICLAESLLKYPEFNAFDLMNRFDRWNLLGENSSTGRCFDIGNTTISSLRKFRQTGNPYSGSEEKEGSGNGSLMRLAPVPILFWNDSGKADEISTLQSRTTHGSEDAKSACIYLSRVICGFISGLGKDSLLQKDDSWPESVKQIAKMKYVDLPRNEIYSSGYVIDTLEAALWSFSQADDFEEAVLLAANLGEDSDTVAAVTGQIAGAFWGFSSIPKKWVELIYESDRIQKLANDLFNLSIKRTET
jgi:ADP-ribosyl-[dinitrogen reductase] hydrolase